jgi:hypothetical protein
MEIALYARVSTHDQQTLPMQLKAQKEPSRYYQKSLTLPGKMYSLRPLNYIEDKIKLISLKIFLEAETL